MTLTRVTTTAGAVAASLSAMPVMPAAPVEGGRKTLPKSKPIISDAARSAAAPLSRDPPHARMHTPSPLAAMCITLPLPAMFGRRHDMGPAALAQAGSRTPEHGRGGQVDTGSRLWDSANWSRSDGDLQPELPGASPPIYASSRQSPQHPNVIPIDF